MDFKNHLLSEVQIKLGKGFHDILTTGITNISFNTIEYPSTKEISHADEAIEENIKRIEVFEFLDINLLPHHKKYYYDPKFLR